MTKIMNIIKIIEFNARITIFFENNIIPNKNNETHGSLRILNDNNENYKNHRIPNEKYKNHGNHKVPFEVQKQIVIIMKFLRDSGKS